MIVVLAVSTLGMAIFVAEFANVHGPQPFNQPQLEALVAHIEAANTPAGNYCLQNLANPEGMAPVAISVCSRGLIIIDRDKTGAKTVQIIHEQNREFTYGYAYTADPEDVYELPDIGRPMPPHWWEIRRDY